MTSIRTLQRSFAGGEVTPEFWSRIDDAKYQTGLATCRNFICKPQGPAENRAGTQFVREVKDSSKRTRIIPFTYSTNQTMVIELGAGYFRFHTQGGTLLSSGAPYEVANPYAEADLFDIHYVQSADVLTLVHPNYPPKELRRLGATNWQLTDISFASKQVAPTGVGAAHTAGTGGTGASYTYKYVITAVGDLGTDESPSSAVATCTGNLFTSGAYNTITWSASAGAVRYYVYKFSGGVFGYIGQTDQTSFTDDNIGADVSRTPPQANNPFNAAGDYPAAVSYFEQRRCFAGTLNKPQNIWMTKSGTESNLSYGLPLRDDDSIQFRVAAREANTIRHVIPLTNLVLLTSAAEWQVTSVNSDAVTPSTISVKPQSYVGANNVSPVIIANTLIYAAARGGHVREMAYQSTANGYVTGDLALRAPHLFDGYEIADLAYAKAPVPIVWAISTSGKLLGLTYIPEQQVGAWHRHDTDGAFESCAVVAEGQEDVLYVVVKRTINGQQKRYIEFLHTRRFTEQKDAYFVDCGLTYAGAPATTISGLDHLEGKTVSILGDGAVMPQAVVTGGAVTVSEPVSTAQVGLPITADLQTLPLAFEAQGYGQGRNKNVDRAWLRVYKSGGIFVGPDAEHLTEAKQRTTEVWGAPPELKTDEIQIDIAPSWGANAQVFVRQADPLPLTITGMSLEVTIGA
jgi:hypothetical protein